MRLRAQSQLTLVRDRRDAALRPKRCARCPAASMLTPYMASALSIVARLWVTTMNCICRANSASRLAKRCTLASSSAASTSSSTQNGVGIDLQQAEQQRDDRQRALAAAQRQQALQLLARRSGDDVDARAQQVVRLGQDQPRLAAAEQLREALLERGLGGARRLRRKRSRMCALELGRGLLQLGHRRPQIGRLVLEEGVPLAHLAVLLDDRIGDAADRAQLALQRGDAPPRGVEVERLARLGVGSSRSRRSCSAQAAPPGTFGLELGGLVDLGVQALQLVGGALGVTWRCLARFVRGALGGTQLGQAHLLAAPFGHAARRGAARPTRAALPWARARRGRLRLGDQRALALGELGRLGGQLFEARGGRCSSRRSSAARRRCGRAAPPGRPLGLALAPAASSATRSAWAWLTCSLSVARSASSVARARPARRAADALRPARLERRGRLRSSRVRACWRWTASDSPRSSSARRSSSSD